MVTVIVPVYNREKTIEKCVDSIITQSFADLEVILVDDGSTDQSGEICDKYAKSDNRVKTFHISNSGVAYARNYGIKHSSGDYVTFVDSDDYLSRDYISKLFSAIDNSEYIMSVCNYSEIIDEKEYPRLLYPNTTYESDKYIDDILYCRTQGGLCWGKMYKRKLIKGYFKKFNYCEDVLFVFDYLSNNSGLIMFVADSLYNYVRHSSSITGTRKSIDLKDAVAVADNIFEECEKFYMDHVRAARAFLVSNSLFAYLQISQEKCDEADQLREKVKKLVSANRNCVLLDKDASLKTKGACIISFISYKVLVALYSAL